MVEALQREGDAGETENVIAATQVRGSLMGLPAVKRVSTKRVIDLKKLDSVADEFLLPEVLSLTSEWGLDENRTQMKLSPPNITSRVIVDRKYPTELTPVDAKALARADNVTFIGMKRNLRFLYTDLALLAQAVKFAWHRLRSLTQKGETGGARASYRMWCSDPDTGRTLETRSIQDVERWLAKSASPGVRVAIQGPTQGDRRKRIYREGGTQKSKWLSPSKAYNVKRDGVPKAIDRFRFLKPKDSYVGRAADGAQLRSNAVGLVLKATHGKRRSTYRAGVAQAIQETVQRDVRRRYRDIGVYYGFKPNKGQWDFRKSDNPKRAFGEFIPEIAFRLKRGFK